MEAPRITCLGGKGAARLHTPFTWNRRIPISLMYLPRGTNMNTRTDLLNGHGWPGYLWVILSHGLFFGVTGPPIGAILSPGVIIYPVAVVAAYFVSFYAAVITGLLVGFGSLFIRGRWIYLAGTAIGAACAMIFPFAFAPTTSPGFVLTIYAIAGGFAGLVCTRLTRWLRLRWAQA